MDCQPELAQRLRHLCSSTGLLVDTLSLLVMEYSKTNKRGMDHLRIILILAFDYMDINALIFLYY